MNTALTDTLKHFFDITHETTGSKNNDKEEAYIVYRNNYSTGLTDALGHIFPSCKKYLGEDLFSALAVVYSQLNPSKHWDINQYGEHFPELIAAQQPHKYRSIDWKTAGYLAKIEYALNNAYYAANPPTFDFIAFENLTTNNIPCCFLLNPSLHYKQKLKQKINSDDIPNKKLTAQLLTLLEDQHQQLDIKTSVLQQPNIIVYRISTTLILEGIDHTTLKFLESINTGVSLHSLAENEFSEKLNELLSRAIQQQWIIGIEAINNDRQQHEQQ